jgi:hypothetical protein
MRSFKLQMRQLECCKRQRKELKQVLKRLLHIEHPSPQEIEGINRIKRERAKLKLKIQLNEQVFGFAT